MLLSVKEIKLKPQFYAAAFLKMAKTENKVNTNT